MDIYQYIEKATKASRDKSFARSGQLTLGEIINKIELIIKDKPELPTVIYDFEYLFPTEIDSWRGSYDELALNYSTEGTQLYADGFLKILKDTVGKKLEGYKGGEYVMTESTPVWVANYGNSGNTAVLDVIDGGYQIILITGYREF